MPIDKHGFVWDPQQWAENAKAQRREMGAQSKRQLQTPYRQALYAWHLKQKMLKHFGHRPWMRGVVHPDKLQWDEQGNRIRPPGARELSDDHTIIEPPKPKRRLLY